MVRIAKYEVIEGPGIGDIPETVFIRVQLIFVKNIWTVVVGVEDAISILIAAGNTIWCIAIVGRSDGGRQCRLSEQIVTRGRSDQTESGIDIDRLIDANVRRHEPVAAAGARDLNAIVREVGRVNGAAW